MFKLIIIDQYKPMAVHTSPERDTIESLAKLAKTKDTVAMFLYDGNSLYQHSFHVA